MPYFYNHKDSKEFGSITIKPSQWYRRLLINGSYCIFPYITMGKIEFTIYVDQLPQQSDYMKRNVYIRLGDGSYRTLTTITDKITKVVGIAEYTGDTKILIASSSYSFHNSERFIDKEGLLLFDDNILSINNYIFGGGSLIVLISTLLCVLLGWLLGFIKLIPFWQLWIPLK